MRIPGPVELSAAWSGLPEALRDHIGFVAPDMESHELLSGILEKPQD